MFPFRFSTYSISTEMLLMFEYFKIPVLYGLPSTIKYIFSSLIYFKYITFIDLREKGRRIKR